jgi:hypothetical protein
MAPQKLCHPNIASVGDSSYLIEYRQQSYTAFTVESAETDLQQLLEVRSRRPVLDTLGANMQLTHSYHVHLQIMGSLPELAAVNVLRQLLEALTYLHAEVCSQMFDSLSCCNSEFI